ncbi:MAG: transglutaminaseTgpA domain-containing protein [Desulfuromonadales bacterium]
MVRIKRLLDLFSGVVALLSMGPVLAYLDRPLLPVVLLAIPAGYWCDRREQYPLPTWLATLVALSGMLFYALQITRAEVAIPVVHAMVVLLAVRLLTPKAGRDYLQIFVLALFILAGSSLIHLEISFIVYLVLLVFGVTLGLVFLTVYVTDQKLAMSRQDLMKLVKVGLVIPAISLLLMMIFFVVLPRTRHPLWNFLNPSDKGVVGLAETVQPGSFAKISGTKELAFRAEGPELAPEDRYWRALVLNQSREGRWVRSDPPGEGTPRIEGPAPVIFMIYPEPRSDRYLMTLDRATLVTGVRHEQTVDQMYIARSALDRRFRFEVRASPGARLRVAGNVNREFYLQTPAEISQRMRQVSAGIRDGSTDVTARIDALAEFFRDQELSYAEDDLPSGPDPIDAFLFVNKRGYCEFFASAYMTLARLAGIPARLVGGYYGGDYNPMGGYYLVTEATAHVWVEVLAGDNSWQRIDPSQWAINAATTLGARDRDQLSALRQLADSLNYHWVQAVVVFDLGQQMSLFREAGDRLRSLRTVRAPDGWWKVAGGLLVGMALLAGILSLRRKSKEARLLEEFRSRIKKRYGHEVLSPGSGLAELGEQLDNESCREFARIYYGAIFRDRLLTRPERVLLKGLLKRI